MLCCLAPHPESQPPMMNEGSDPRVCGSPYGVSHPASVPIGSSHQTGNLVSAGRVHRVVDVSASMGVDSL